MAANVACPNGHRAERAARSAPPTAALVIIWLLIAHSLANGYAFTLPAASGLR